MDKDTLNAYATRVSQANRSELVVIMYEIFLDSVKEGKKYLSLNQMEDCRREIGRARGILTELLGSLDFSYEISYYLRRLYVFAYRELCQGIALREEARLDHASDVINKLLPSFRQVAQQDSSESIVQGTETIYAGLTYGRNSLNESVGIDLAASRGFQA